MYLFRICLHSLAQTSELTLQFLGLAGHRSLERLDNPLFREQQQEFGALLIICFWVSHAPKDIPPAIPVAEWSACRMLQTVKVREKKTDGAYNDLTSNVRLAMRIIKPAKAIIRSIPARMRID